MKTCIGYLLVCIVLLMSTPSFLEAQEPEFPPPATRTIVADVLDVEGEFIIVRGELGEIRIEVKDDTKISEAFEFGDRVKAVLRPNDSAISVVRAGKDEPAGTASETLATPSASKKATPPSPSAASSGNASPTQTEQPAPPPSTGPTTRIIVADILMVDGDFYVVRGERGEIRIEATADTKVSEAFDFGDRIKAKVLPNDKAIFIERAKADDVVGIQTLEPSVQAPHATKSQTADVKTAPVPPAPEQATPKRSKGTRTIVADVLMIDGDFIIVRGERGEIQIEVTPKTRMTEEFNFGDKIRAIVTSNDQALSVERAKPDEPVGITEN